MKYLFEILTKLNIEKPLFKEKPPKDAYVCNINTRLSTSTCMARTKYMYLVLVLVLYR
jgi:hypothetical protein